MYDHSIDYFGPHKKPEKPKKIKSFPSFAVDRYLKKHGHLPCEPKPKKISAFTFLEKLFLTIFQAICFCGIIICIWLVIELVILNFK